MHPSPSQLPTSIAIGALDKSELLGALRARDVQLNRAAELLFQDDRFQPQAGQLRFELAAFSVSGLGFRDGASYGQITARALEGGFTECPLELGAHLRLQFDGQPTPADQQLSGAHRAPHGSITVASAPLDHEDETPKGFYLVRRGSQRWLRGYWAPPDYLWHPDDNLLFCRRSQ